ncbi:hypothetical protein ACE5IS_19635 [Leptospira wolffii]|uniref:Uncharacterized protein n=1 Tax=Leptospira wolffii TaxID=409998 RepID=A0ABV5BTR8_9LEPT
MTVLLWNFDPIYRIVYLSAKGLIFVKVDLEKFHNEFSLWLPVGIGLLLVPLRRGLELVGAFSFVFLESLYNRWLHRAESPDLHKQIAHLKSIEVKLKTDLEKKKSFTRDIFTILSPENMRFLAKNLLNINEFSLSKVKENVGIGSFLTYNVRTDEYQQMERSDAFNGILVHSFSNKYGLVAFSGFLPAEILPFEDPKNKTIGNYKYDPDKSRLVYTSYTTCHGRVKENDQIFEILNCEKYTNVSNPIQDLQF